MKNCHCGKELAAGTVKCWNPHCGAEFVVPVHAESSDPPIKKSDELRQLESQYRLATRGLPARAPKTYAAMVICFLIFVVAALLLAATGKQLFPGWPLVWVFGIFATGYPVRILLRKELFKWTGEPLGPKSYMHFTESLLHLY